MSSVRKPVWPGRIRKKVKGIKMTKTAVKDIIKKAGYFPDDEFVEIVIEAHDQALTPKMVKVAFTKREARKAKAKAGDQPSQESAAATEQAKTEDSKATETAVTATAAVTEQSPADPEKSK